MIDIEAPSLHYCPNPSTPTLGGFFPPEIAATHLALLTAVGLSNRLPEELTWLKN